MKSIWTKENVEDAVKHTSNIRQCLIYLGVDPRSSSRNTLKKRIQEYNIDTSHFVLKSYNRTYNGETQVCNCCGKEKPITEFYINSRNKTGIQPTCKECMKSKYNPNRRAKASEVKLNLIKELGGKCVRCGIEANINNYVIFDFHHIDPSKKDFSINTFNGSLEDMEKEAKKCVVMCANCHRLHHFNLKRNGKD